TAGAAAGVLAAVLVVPAGPSGTPARAGSAPGSTAATTGPTPGATAGSLAAVETASTEGLRIVLDDVDPVVARVGEPVELSGRVVNDGEGRRRLTSLTVSATWEPLGSRAAVTDWVEATDPALEAGRVIGDDAIGPVVAPGRELPFTVRVPEDALTGLVLDRGVLGLQLRAEDAEDGAGPVGGDPVSLRTVLSVTAAEEAPEVPLALSWVVPLTLPPDPGLLSADPEVRNAAWYAVAGPGSPARTWLDGLDLPGVTWMVDPALLRMLSPAGSLTGPGEDAPDEGTEEEPDQPGDTPRETADDPEETDRGDPAGQTGGPAGSDGTAETAVPAPAPSATPAPSTTDDGRRTAPPEGTTASSVPAPAPAPDDGTGSGGSEDGDDTDSDGAAEELDTADVETALLQLRGRLARVDGPRLWWLPTDDPDLSALADLGVDDATVHRLLTRQPVDPPAQLTRLLRRGTSTVAWPVEDAPTTEQVATLAAWWDARDDPDDGPGAGRLVPPQDEDDGPLDGVVVPRESITGSSGAPVGSAAVPLVDVPGVTALGSDSRLAGLLADAGADAAQVGAAAVTQRVLADTLTAHQEAPGVARSLVVAPPRGTALPADVLDQVVAGLESASWVEPVTAADLLARAGSLPPASLTGVAPEESVLGGLTAYLEPAPSPLDPGRARSLDRLEDELEGLSEVLTDTDAVRSWQPVLPDLWSARWRGAADPWSRTWRALRDLSAQTRAQVHANPSTINFLSDQGLMQVTVVNDLPVGVHDVQARLVPDRALLRVVDQPGPVSVGPGSRATVSFSARAVTRGQTLITAELTTPNGTVLGDDAVVEVRVQPTGTWIYWVLGGLAGVLLVLGTVRALRGGPRPDGRRSPASPSTPTKEQPT
ncbi:MAG TPA: DUF6049 family protein, partial [Ornithinimicrobium sp.]|nr:DUF6049 family protein [Ornithinimicrobium sp.]